MADRTILHCDCNAYFASVECIDRPELKRVPMAVCGDPKSRHGIILAKNELAKKYGVATAETVWQAKKKCPQLVLVSPHHGLYELYSGRINDIYEQYTDLVEPFSVDESWLDISGSLHLFGSGERVADELRQRVRDEIGITISVGVSFNKIFAKLGSDYKKPDATTVITRGNYRSVLWPLPARDMLFVGRVAAERLLDDNIRTIGQIAEAGREHMIALLGRSGQTIWEYASGLDTSPVKPRREAQQVKSVGCGTTYARDLAGRDEVCPALLLLSDQVGTRLRRQKLYCSTVQVQMRDPFFKTISRQQKLPAPTNVTHELYEAAVAVVERAGFLAAPVRMLTVTAENLTDRCAEQLQLFGGASEKREKRQKLDGVVDTIRSRYGKDAIAYASVMKRPEGGGEADDE